MAWFKVDDGFWSHPKTLALSNDAIALWLRSGTWSCQQLTDGFIADHALLMFGITSTAVDELVEIGYWDRDYEAQGYVFHDWDEYQEASEKVKARRAAARERMKTVRANKERTQEERSQEQNAKFAKSSPNPDPTRPDPTRPTTSNEVVKPTHAPSVLGTLFIQSWQSWPKKVERKQAETKFRAAAKKFPNPEDLARAVARFGDAYAATTERQYVPALGVWLNGERWTDELPQAPTQGKTKPTPEQRARQTMALAMDIDMKEIEQ